MNTSDVSSGDAAPAGTPMPMFPLGMPLLPGGLLPLNIFEQRYRQMLADCLAPLGPQPEDVAAGTPYENSPSGVIRPQPDVPRAEFGQVLITRGTEAGGGDERAMIGCVAQIVRVEEQPGGTYGVIAVGTRRIEIDAWLPDDPYPIARVSDFPDLVASDLDLDRFRSRCDELHRAVRQVVALAVELGEMTADALQAADLEPPDDDPVTASYRLAATAPAGPADRYRLLAAAGPEERLDVLGDVLGEVESMLRFRLT